MSGIRDATRAIENLGVPPVLADDLVSYMTKVGKELRKFDLEKSSTGKFVETVVQVLQALQSPMKKYDLTVRSVEDELTAFESRAIPGVNNESRLGIVRITRAIQCVRSKRGMVHKNLIDPNVFDLEFVYHGAQWIVTELVRLGSDSTVSDAVEIVREIQRPVLPIVEHVFDRPLVLHTKVSAPSELLIVLRDGYSVERTMSRKEISKALDRRNPSTVTNALKALWSERLIDGNGKDGYRLTALGVSAADKVLEDLLLRGSP